MALPRDFIDELHLQNDIAEVIGSYLSLRKRGRVHTGLCPFHSEKTPSFTVYPESQSFYCFGCNTGGDVITFVMKRDNLDYIEAVTLLARRAGMAMPEDTDGGQARLRRRILEANKAAARFYFDTLNSESGREVRAYLRRRGLSDSSIKRFGIGYSPPGWNGLRDHLHGQGFSNHELIAAGLCADGRKSVYDLFRGRVMFPIIDLRGSVAAFGGRTMADGPKYVNTSDTEVFKKSRSLFALNIAKNESGRTLILAEGYMDVVALHQAGFQSAVATLGTALTAEQARMMANYADEAVIAYDSDEAGSRATRRAIDILKNTGLRVRVLALEGAKDPDEYLKKFGAERLRMLLSESGSSLEYELGRAREKYPLATDEGKVRFLADAAEILARCQSLTEREVYAGRIAEELKVGKAAILAQAEEIGTKKAKRRERDFERKLSDIAAQYHVSPSRRGAIGVAAAEQRLLALLFRNPDLLSRVKDRIAGEDFFSEDAALIYAALSDAIGNGDFSGFGSLNGRITEGQMSVLAGIVAMNANVAFGAADADFLTDKMKKTRHKPDSEQLKHMNREEIGRMIAEKKRNSAPR